MRIVLDCDDVLYMTNETALDKMNREYGTDFSMEDIYKWGEIGSMIDRRLEYFSDASFIGSVPLYPDAESFVNTLLKQGHEVFLCSSVSFSCAEARVESIKRNFLAIKEENIMIAGRKDLLLCDYMLDDRIENIIMSKAKSPIIFEKPWNRSYHGCHGEMVHDYGSFLSMLGLS